jgi:hypothetical protein
MKELSTLKERVAYLELENQQLINKFNKLKRFASLFGSTCGCCNCSPICFILPIHEEEAYATF